MGEENEDVISPDTSAPETQDAVSEVEQTSEAGNGAGSSDAPTQGDKAPQSIADVVRDAVPPVEEAAASPADEGDDPKDGADADADPAAEEDDFSDVPFHAHPRFKKVISQRDQYRAGHEQFQNIRSFLETNGIADEEAAGMLQWLALSKQDPQKAWAHIKPQIQQLLLDAGEVLPADLRQQVQDGRLTKEAAQLVARERAERTKATNALERQQQTFQRDSAAREEQARRETVSAWEMRRQKDPDYAALQPRLLEKATYLMHTQGKPTTAEGITKQLDEAWKAVKAEMRAAQPRKPELKPVMGGRTAGSPAPQPKSTLDIIRAHTGG